MHNKKKILLQIAKELNAGLQRYIQTRNWEEITHCLDLVKELIEQLEDD